MVVSSAMIVNATINSTKVKPRSPFFLILLLYRHRNCACGGGDRLSGGIFQGRIDHADRALALADGDEIEDGDGAGAGDAGLSWRSRDGEGRFAGVVADVLDSVDLCAVACEHFAGGGVVEPQFRVIEFDLERSRRG